jgi:predicted amidophosphoribosyltransferase
MPMPWQRRFYRGINHAYEIARGVAIELHAPVVRLLRKRMQAPQVSLSPSERRRAGRRGLSVRRRFSLAVSPDSILGWDLHDLQLILVDDVRTTGATLMGASRMLSRLKPAKIVCGVLAVSDSSARRKRAERVFEPSRGREWKE